MGDNEEWRSSVETRLVMLTSAQKTSDDDIDELALKQEEIDQLLHGDRSSRDSGIVGQLDAIETKVNSILAILHPDSTGHSGLLHEHRQLKEQVYGRQRWYDKFWNFWTAVILLLLGTATYIVRDNWKEISSDWKKQSQRKTELDRRIESAKRGPRVKKVVPRIKVVPAPATAGDETPPGEPAKDGVP